MRNFLFLDKEYKIKASFRRNRKIRDPAVELARLLRKAFKPKFGRVGSSRRAPDLRQRCVAKLQYSNSKEAHGVQLEKYLVLEGKGRDGKAPQLFGTDLEEYKENMVGKNFRIFLSPESSQVDVHKLAERFIAKLEKQTGYRLYWQGACHYDTAHPHAHLLINGKDKRGREIEIPRDIVKTFMRETARDLCTSQLGHRTSHDLAREKEQQLVAPRFTRLDSYLENLCQGTNRVSLDGPIYDKERILARLETLRKLKLCTYENGGYTLKENWQEDLKSNGRYNAFLKARDSLQYTDPSLMKLFSGEQERITGKVIKIYRTDGDASDNHAVLLEGIDGKAYFIPLLKKPEFVEFFKKTKAIETVEIAELDSEDGKSSKPKTIRTPLKEGEFATVSTYTSQRGRLTPTFFKVDETKTKQFTNILEQKRIIKTGITLTGGRSTNV